MQARPTEMHENPLRKITNKHDNITEFLLMCFTLLKMKCLWSRVKIHFFNFYFGTVTG